MTANLSISYNDTIVFHFDTNTFFNQVMNDLKAYPQMAGYKNTTDPCPDYFNVREVEAFDKECGVLYKEYFWRDMCCIRRSLFRKLLLRETLSILVGEDDSGKRLGVHFSVQTQMCLARDGRSEVLGRNWWDYDASGGASEARYSLS